MWLILMLLLVEFALTSGQEREYQAAWLSWIIFFFLLTGGLAVNYVHGKEATQKERDHLEASPAGSRPQQPEIEERRNPS